MSFASLLIDTCTVQRFTEGSSGPYGNPVITWADHLAEEACRIQPSSGVELKIGAELVVADYLLFLGDVDVTEQDRIVLDSITYQILLVKDEQDGVDSHHKEVFLRVSR